MQPIVKGLSNARSDEHPPRIAQCAAGSWKRGFTVIVWMKMIRSSGCLSDMVAQLGKKPMRKMETKD